ncbi:hypothetical protein SAMN05428944_3478 [Streptomyces sp. 1222.5]|uniref:hypothetical protein n=1 Tax=unclassified Streptomyces TaxID=2593676 RepID=UPI00089BAAC1|nr:MULTISPECIES: hypothetical protein [unclassified Streptomyces]PKW09366.1 hypothetical protein BX260_4615 [Streptomyces sp. 5112.2]SEC37172.1 hypothetical protein SAMN05428944_3478 [Streptomyces sp. 1222.5]SED53980.1 hypothetical protein SAMN05216532_4872 [Streptomyces sp. 2231.1]
MPIFVLEFFGTIHQVMGAVDTADLAFFFGPHLLGERAVSERAALSLHFAPRAGAGRRDREVRVLDGEGRLLRRWAFHGIGGIPPMLPPFAVMNQRYALVQAAVLAKGDSVVALIGGVGSPRNSVALALGGRGWRMVSGRYLVVDRVTGRTLPYQLPLELRGAALESARAAGLTDGPSDDLRPVCSPLTGSSVQVRPERLLATAAVDEALAPAALVRLCTGGAYGCRLEDWDFAPSVWPSEAAADLAAAPRMRLLMPESGGAEEAADLLDERLTAPAAKGAPPCPAVPPTPRERPAGSATRGSTPPGRRTSTRASSVGSSDPRAAAAIT